MPLEGSDLPRVFFCLLCGSGGLFLIFDFFTKWCIVPWKVWIFRGIFLCVVCMWFTDGLCVICVWCVVCGLRMVCGCLFVFVCDFVRFEGWEDFLDFFTK